MEKITPSLIENSTKFYLRTALKSPCAKLDSIETDTSGILLNKDIDHEGEKTSS